MSIYIVVRRPVNWLNFREEESIPFCRAHGMPETLIVDFCALWRREMRLSFQEMRHALAEIASRSWEAVGATAILAYDKTPDLRLDDADTVLLTDDDDWFSPDVAAVPPDSVWGSVAILNFLHPPERRLEPAVMRRPFENVVFTNSAALSGDSFRRLDTQGVLEHFEVDAARRAGSFRPASIERYLSCANKHFCCATAIRANMQSEVFVRDPRAAVRTFVEDLQAASLDDLTWMEAPRRELAVLFRDCLGD